ncbi:DUF4190 domain-containing protein [Geodermatophilus sabuli]|uniref:DUF4190 domain-containing protein n=1 Tax=Geodermatophilus sabuli TaxID=1564158 RepID=A0A7K3W788_9ACTN|nr:DUF4190 domain-containing protein [Geodermatophilus sabuli]NEK60631.1 DUF4190 domain-containing protein [Geodermatophilus sabuli]
MTQGHGGRHDGVDGPVWDPQGGPPAAAAGPAGHHWAPQPPPPPGAVFPGPYGYPYGPPYGYPYPPPQRTNGLAIASMVLGILWLYWIGSILALVFGYVAKNQIRERGDAGGGMATAGIVLGWVGVGVFALVLVAGIASSA